MISYTEGVRTAKLKKEVNLHRAEVRLFLWFLVRKRGALSDKKAEEFQKYVEEGELPKEIGMITKKQGQIFCIRQTHPNYYTLYVSVDETSGFNQLLRRMVKKVKK